MLGYTQVTGIFEKIYAKEILPAAAV